MDTIISKTMLDSPMTMCEQSISIMKKNDDGIKQIGIESPMTMCEQSISIMKKNDDGIKQIGIESPMTMCEQSISIMKKNDDSINTSETLCNYETEKSRIDISNLSNYSMLKRMIA